MPSPTSETRAEITDLLLRYATGIDRRDWDLFRTCFTEDCTLDYGPIGPWDGLDAATTWMDETHQRFGMTMHRMTNAVIDHDGDSDTAVARSYVNAVLATLDGTSSFQGNGVYDDQLVRTDDGWKIQTRRFTAMPD